MGLNNIQYNQYIELLFGRRKKSFEGARFLAFVWNDVGGSFLELQASKVLFKVFFRVYILRYAFSHSAHQELIRRQIHGKAN